MEVIKTIEFNNSNNSSLDSTRTVSMNIETEDMNLDEIANNDETSANVSAGSIKSKISNLMQSALEQLESITNISKIENSDNTERVINMTIPENKEKTGLNISIERDYENAGKVTGKICPGTSENTFIGKSYNLNDEEMDELIALVYSEADESHGYTESDSMGVTSVVLNRLEDGHYGDTVYDVIHQENAFEGTIKTKFDEAKAGTADIKPEMIHAVNRVLNGERNTSFMFFSGNGEFNTYREKF